MERIHGFSINIKKGGMFYAERLIFSRPTSPLKIPPGFKFVFYSAAFLGSAKSTKKVQKHRLNVMKASFFTSSAWEKKETWTFWKDIGVSKKLDTPKWMVKIMENPIKMGWFGGKKPYFWKHPHTLLIDDPPVFLKTQHTSDPRHWKTLSAVVMAV